MRALLAGFSAAASALLLAGCGGGNSLTTSGQCAPPSGTQLALVYPAPGATGIPGSFGLVVLGSTAALPSSYQVHVVDNAHQNALLFGNMSAPPNPLPTPNVAPAFSDPVFQASVNPGRTFAAGSTVTVYLNNESGNSYCLATLDLGSFVVRSR
jgi:hypothetical protein